MRHRMIARQPELTDMLEALSRRIHDQFRLAQNWLKLQLGEIRRGLGFTMAGLAG